MPFLYYIKSSCFYLQQTLKYIQVKVIIAYFYQLANKKKEGFMPQSSFAVLFDVGTLVLDPGSEVKFSIDAYRGYRYASIRKYLTSGSYTGATRAGITMTPEIVKALAPILAALPDTPQQINEVELGKFAKRPGMSVVVRVSVFQGSKGLDLRQWQEDSSYKGWTKKGIRLPIEKIKEIKALFAQLAQALEEKPIMD